MSGNCSETIIGTGREEWGWPLQRRLIADAACTETEKGALLRAGRTSIARPTIQSLKKVSCGERKREEEDRRTCLSSAGDAACASIPALSASGRRVRPLPHDIFCCSRGVPAHLGSLSEQLEDQEAIGENEPTDDKPGDVDA